MCWRTARAALVVIAVLSAQLSVTVFDTLGGFVSGATTASGTANSTTYANGKSTL
jgi:hypothetical protein